MQNTDIPESPALIRFLMSKGNITHSQAGEIAAYFNDLHLPKHEHLLNAGQVNDAYLFLETGFMRAYVYDTEGNEVTTDFFAPGQVVFDVASFFQRTQSEEYLEALIETKGKVLTYAQLNHLFHTRPEFREFGRSILVQGFIAFKTRTLTLINKTAEERYRILLERAPEIFTHAPLKYIASYLGITDTSLSRIRKNITS